MQSLVEGVSLLLLSKQKKLVTAESCTGGLIAAAITDRAGSSAVFDRGFVTYSNESKMDMLDVQAQTIQNYGAVSEQTARVMALGALQKSLADVAVSVTGIAGPTGGTAEKPVGLVYMGVGMRGQNIVVTRHVFTGDRTAIRQQTVETALERLIEILS